MKNPFTFLAAGLLVAAALQAADSPPAAAPDEGLVITSVGPAESATKGTQTTITFHDTVEARDNDLRVTCDLLEVVVDSRGNGSAAPGQPAKFKSMVATGHVAIYRGTDVATCGRAEISQDEDTIVLSDNPVLHHPEDGSSQTPGPHGRIIYHRGERQVESVPGPGEQTQFVLPKVKTRDLIPGAKPAAPPAPAP